MTKILKYILISFVLVIFICLAVYYFNVNLAVSGTGQDRFFTIAKGESVKQISQNLFEQKLIKSKFYFEIYIWLTKKQAKFLAGEYALKSNMNIKEITDVLTSGQVVNREKTIKIIEGWKIADINKYLVSNQYLSDDSFLKLASTKISAWPFAMPKPDFLNNVPMSANLEGFLFPDTYRIFNDAKAEDVISKMLDNFGNKHDENLRAEIKAQNKTIYEIVTLASIVEKEVSQPEDMKIVAGIFLNRLKSNQALESCATLAYVLGVNKTQYTAEDTMVDSLYNTYKYRGLPPGPIANPGLAALTAAIYPESTDYNYFLSRPDNGETVFSKTYDEHVQNKTKYLPL